MATYFVSVHDLRLRLLAQQEAEEEQICYFSNPCTDDGFELETDYTAQSPTPKRRKFDARSTSCPAMRAETYVPTQNAH